MGMAKNGILGLAAVALVAAAVDTFGSVDVMVNNAGTMPLAFCRSARQ